MAKKNSLTLALVAAMFAAHPKIDELFVTSDGQGFTTEQKAMEHARYLKDKEVAKHQRDVKVTDENPEDENPEDENPEDENPEGENPEDENPDRESLLAQYEELFGRKASHNISDEKLKERVEAELKKSE